MKPDRITTFPDELGEEWKVRVQVWVSPLRRELAQDFMHEESGEVADMPPELSVEDGA